MSDTIAELNEITTVTLTDIVENGVPASDDQSRGASLAPGQSEAVVTVAANDDPHGVVTWSPTLVMAEEEEGRNSVARLTIVREFGAIGAIVVSYSTAMEDSQSAESLQDFVPTAGDVVIADGQSSVSISITILQVKILA